MAELNEKLVKQISDEIERLNGEIIKLGNSYSEMATQLGQSNQELNKSKKTTEELKKAEEQLNSTTEKLYVSEKEAQKAAAELDKQRQKALQAIEKQTLKELELQTAMSKEVKSEDDLIKKTDALVAIRRKLDKTTDEGKAKHAALTAEIAKNTIELKESDAQIKRNFRSVGDYEVAGKSLLAELKGITLQLGQMKLRGEENTESFKKLAQRGGEITDAMSDIRQELKLLGSDTKYIDMMVSSFTAIGSAAQVAEGATQLFGSENENVTRGIQKMVAIQSILTGVQEIGNALQRESGLMMTVNAVKTKVLAGAQAIYTTAVGTSTGATKAFKVALLSTGIGAIIVGIGLLVANWDKLSSAIGGTSEKLKKYNKELELKLKLKKNNSEWDEFALDIMKERGATDEQITAKEIENNKNRQNANLNLIKTLEEINKTGKITTEQTDQLNNLNDESIKLGDKAILLNLRLRRIKEENSKKEIEEAKKTNNETKKINEDKLKEQEDSAKALFEFKKKMGLLSDDEIYNNEVESIKKSKEFALLSEQEKILALAALWDAEYERRNGKMDTIDDDDGVDKATAKLDEIADRETADDKRRADASEQRLLDEADIERRRVEIRQSSADSIRAILGQESTIGKLATAAQRIEALKQMGISMGIITSKSAEAQARAAAAYPPPFNIPFILMAIAQFVGIIGLFKKAKKFKLGTGGKFNTPDTFETSEPGAGIEAVEKDGKVTITKKPTIFTGMKGARVYSNPELRKLAQSSMSINTDIKGISELRNDINNGNKMIAQTIRSKPTFVFDKSNRVIGSKRDNRTVMYVEQLMNG
jgi:hypothetical protein